MGGNSSNGNTSSGGLSGLFMGNTPTQTGQHSALPTITAPQSLIGQMDFSNLPSSQSAPQSAPPPPARTSTDYFGRPIVDTTPGGHYGFIQAPYSNDHGAVQYTQQYAWIPDPAPPPAPAPYQPSRASQLAAAINAQYGKK